MIRTPRLVLRRFRPADAPVFAAYRSEPEVARYQSWEAPYPVEQAAAFVAEMAAADPARPGWFQYAVERTADGLMLGDVAVRRHDDPRRADLGCTLAGAHQRHGYAREALTAVLEHLFAGGLHKASATADARNTASRTLLERLGFVLEGVRRQHTWDKGEWTDDALYGLLATDPRPGRPR